MDSAGKFDTLRTIGADQVIDCTQEDFAQSGQTYDVIFDVIGKSSFSGSMKSLTQSPTTAPLSVMAANESPGR